MGSGRGPGGEQDGESTAMCAGASVRVGVGLVCVFRGGDSVCLR